MGEMDRSFETAEKVEMMGKKKGTSHEGSAGREDEPLTFFYN